MRVCILTSNKTRHKYMANRLIQNFDVVGVVSEAKQPKRHLADRIKTQKEEGDEEIAEYLDQFAEAEKKYLYPLGEEFSIPPDVEFITIDPDRLNEDDLYEKIKRLKPDCFAVFGTSLIKRNLLNLSPNFINIHLGLSPYYRGVACSFWPFYNNEPEYVGVTVFYIDEGIDSGPIIHQGLVDLEAGDAIHDASVKAIIKGVDLQIIALEELKNGTIKSQEQDLSVGTVYYNKHFNVSMLRDCLSRWGQAEIDNYVLEQDSKKEKVDYVE